MYRACADKKGQLRPPKNQIGWSYSWFYCLGVVATLLCLHMYCTHWEMHSFCRKSRVSFVVWVIFERYTGFAWHNSLPNWNWHSTVTPIKLLGQALFFKPILNSQTGFSLSTLTPTQHVLIKRNKRKHQKEPRKVWAFYLVYPNRPTMSLIHNEPMIYTIAQV
jgi:hypothetical protein